MFDKELLEDDKVRIRAVGDIQNLLLWKTKAVIKNTQAIEEI